MQNVKGFITVDRFIDNTEGSVAPICELSPVGRTYSKYKEIYHSQEDPELRYIHFHAKDENGIRISPSKEAVDGALTTALWVMDYVRDNITVADPAYITKALEEAFSHYSGVTIAEQIYVDDNWYPTQVYYEDVGNDYSLRIWLSDTAFREQYGEYEIVVVHPVEVVDNMLLPYNEFIIDLSKYTYDVQIDRLNAIGEEHPYTISRSQTYDWYDQDNNELTTEISWTVAIYGVAGDNLERIQEDIISSVYAVSEGTPEQWQAAVPDLFSPTEFILTPMWHKVAIVSTEQENGIHSPIMDNKGQKEIAGVLFSNMNSEHVSENIENTTAIYKSVSMLAIGQSTNRGRIFKLSDVFPDYIMVSTIGSDFARMSPVTQQWVILLQDLLLKADIYAYDNALPGHMVVVIRNNIEYIMSRYNGSQYLVAERTSFLKALDEAGIVEGI